MGRAVLLGKRGSCNICQLVAQIHVEKRNRVKNVSIDRREEKWLQ